MLMKTTVIIYSFILFCSCENDITEFLLVHKNNSIDCSPTATKITREEHHCLYHCINTPDCISFNVKFISKENYRCELFTPKDICHDYTNDNLSKYFFVVFEDCLALYNTNVRKDGVYAISPNKSEAFQVYCDMEGGGWIVFQHRQKSINLDFKRTWNEYKDGFGDVTKDFWLGNDKLHLLTKVNTNELEITIMKEGSVRGKLGAEIFTISSFQEGFTFNTKSQINDDHDLLKKTNGIRFSTYDTGVRPECFIGKGGWWFDFSESCYVGYTTANDDFPSFFDETIMKIRRRM